MCALLEYFHEIKTHPRSLFQHWGSQDEKVLQKLFLSNYIMKYGKTDIE